MTIKINNIIVIIALSCVGLGFLLIKTISNECVIQENTPTFVVWRNGSLCHIEWHYRENLDIVAKFSTINECESYLYKYWKK